MARDLDDGILAGPVDGPARLRAAYPEVPATAGLRVLHRPSGFAGSVIGWEGGGVLVRGRSGQDRVFQPGPGSFHVEGRAVTLIRPTTGAASQPPGRTASGSRAAPPSPARVARASRILVEGVHDAELVERVWGDDLRVEGVVVERLDGADDLAAVVADLRPGPGRRLGVLLDHLVDGSKETRLARSVAHPHVLVTGHPFVDVWQAVKPARLGLDGWPEIPRGQSWKDGVCAAVGAPSPAVLWRTLLGRVRSYADLEPALVGAVESLIDFVTDDETTG